MFRPPDGGIACSCIVYNGLETGPSIRIKLVKNHKKKILELFTNITVYHTVLILTTVYTHNVAFGRYLQTTT